MNQVLQVFVDLLVLVYYWLEGIVLFFVPKSLRYKSVENEVVLITGGGSGLGRLLAVRFARLGAKVVVWDLNQSGIDETCRLVKQLGREPAAGYTCDVSDRNAVYETANRVRQEVGPVTILVNNAGIVSGKRFLEVPDEKIIKTFEVNAISHFWVSDYPVIITGFLSLKKEKKKLSIILLSSERSSLPMSGHSGRAQAVVKDTQMINCRAMFAQPYKARLYSSQVFPARS